MAAFQMLNDLPNAGLVVHAAESWLQDVAAGRFDFFEKLGAKAQAEAWPMALAAAGSPASIRFLQERAHVHVVIGPRQPIRLGVLHAHPGYLRGFWYLDPAGVNMASSLARRAFQPDEIDVRAARFFFDGVTGWNLRRNLSKFPQAPRATLPAAHATVFLQEIEHFASPVHYLDSEKMLKRVARAAEGARVYVKLHPAQRAETTARVQALVGRIANLEISTASIHDLAQASRVVVTQNSAAGFEALMQRKPVITCALCDYHHASVVARNGGQLAQAVQRAEPLMAGFAYEKYLYWFLGQQLLEPAKPEFAALAWDRVVAARRAALA